MENIDAVTVLLVCTYILSCWLYYNLGKIVERVQWNKLVQDGTIPVPDSSVKKTKGFFKK